MHSIFRLLFPIGLLAAFAQSLGAQMSPKQSAMITIGIQEEITASQQYSMFVWSTAPGESNPYEVWWTNYAGLSTPVQSPSVVCQIYPGRMYTFLTGSNSWNWADVHFNVPPGYTVYLGRLYWPMNPRSSFYCTSSEMGATFQESFYVLPTDGASWLQPGYSSGPHIGDIRWSVGAGQLASGILAGSLNMRATSITSALLSAKSLTFASSASALVLSPTNWSSFFTSGPGGYIYPASIPDQVAVYYAPDGSPKFICTNQIEIGIAEIAGGGYYVSTYPAGTGIAYPNSDPTQPWSFSQGWISSTGIGSSTQPFTDGIEIQRTDAATGLVETWVITQTTSNGVPSTTMTQTDVANSTTLRNITYQSTPITGGRSETVTVMDGSNHIASVTTRNYQNFPWGEELVSEVKDPNGLALTTTYTYYNTTSGDGHYSKLQSVTHPDGSWILYNYFDDFAHWGELASVSTPWQDAPTSYTAATSTNCKITTYNYAYEVYDGYQYPSGSLTSVFQTLNAGNQTSITGTVSAHTIVSPNVFLSSAYSSVNFGYEPMRTDTIQSYSASGTYQTSTQTVFHNTADPVYVGKLYSQVNPDGTKTSASYWKGSFSNSLGGPSWASSYFYVNSSSGTWVRNYLTGTSTQQDPTAVQYSSDGVSGGMTIDPVWMTPYKSFRRQTITDIYGNPAYDVTEVFTGSGFQIISWKTTGYTPDGFLLTSQDNTGAFNSYLYYDGKVSQHRNPDGTQMNYLFDGLLRVTQATKNSATGTGTYPSQLSIYTTYTYDGAGDVLSAATQPYGGSPTLITSTVYGLSGLATSATDASNITTSYAYTNGARTVTTTFPNGATQIVDKHLDGTAKSITGNGAVNQFTSAVVNSDGTITTTTNLGTSTSQRWSSIQTDWLSRTISKNQSAYGGSTLVQQSVYNTLGQLAKTTRTGQSATLYQYDGLGELQYTGLDVNNNGLLDLGGTDRITESRTQVYEDANSIWWNRTQTSVFNTLNSSTPVLAKDVRQKLVPYPSSYSDYESGVRITEADTYDYFGNLTTEVINSNQYEALVTDTVTMSDSSVPKIIITYNGLKQSFQSAENLTTTYQYDALGRPTGTTDPRKGTRTTAYYTSGTGQIGRVSTQTDAAGNSTSFAYDSSDGRLFSRTDSLGNIIYSAYDHVGREIKKWGSKAFPVEYAYDTYGSQIAMRTFRSTAINFSGTSWPLNDDGGDPQNPVPTSWTNGDITNWTFDGASGLLTAKTDAQGKAVGYTYNPSGTMATRTWARGTVTTYSYDPNTADRTGISYSDGTPSLSYTFDRLDHGSSIVQSQTGGLSLTTGLIYNVPGKLVQEAFDSTYFAGLQVNYVLDTTHTGTLGRTIGYELGTSSNPMLDQSIAFGFDTYGRFNSDGIAGGPTFTYNYASNANLVGSITDPGDNWSQNRIWEAHRDLLTSIQTSAGGTSEGAFSYIYDQLGRRASKVETGAVFARYPAAGLTDIYTYDSRSEVTGDQEYESTNPTSPTNPVLGRGFAYTYDPIGNRITSSIDSTWQTGYTSNALNQYSSRTVPGYYAVSGFSPAGSAITVNGSTVAASQIQGQYYLQDVTASNSAAPLWLTGTSSSSLGGSVSTSAFLAQTPESYAYDLDGNILSDGRWNYTWDAENRLTAIETYGNKTGQSTAIWNSGVPRIHVDFVYDYEGRRIDKKLSTWGNSAWVVANETRFAYEKWNLTADFLVSGTSLTFSRGYLWGLDLSGKRQGAGGVGGLLALQTSSGNFELPIYEANGNVQGLVDRATGLITANYEYSPYGETIRATGTYATINPFRFASKYTDDESHLNFYGHRYYSPQLGRFLGRDPKGEKGGLHLYAMVRNNLPNRYDLLGFGPRGVPPWASGWSPGLQNAFFGSDDSDGDPATKTANTNFGALPVGIGNTVYNDTVRGLNSPATQTTLQLVGAGAVALNAFDGVDELFAVGVTIDFLGNGYEATGAVMWAYKAVQFTNLTLSSFNFAYNAAQAPSAYANGTVPNSTPTNVTSAASTLLNNLGYTNTANTLNAVSSFNDLTNSQNVFDFGKNLFGSTNDTLTLLNGITGNSSTTTSNAPSQSNTSTNSNTTPNPPTSPSSNGPDPSGTSAMPPATDNTPAPPQDNNAPAPPRAGPAKDDTFGDSPALTDPGPDDDDDDFGETGTC